MTRTCPQCTRPLPPTRNGLDFLREHASAAEWRRYFTAPRGRSSCPQCHATLRKVTTRAGYLCYLGMLVTMGLSAVLIWMFFLVNSLVGQLVPLIAFLCAVPFLVCYSKWGYTWKLK